MLFLNNQEEQENPLTALDLPTLSTLNMAIQNNLKPQALDDNGSPVNLGLEYKAGMTQSMRYYAIMGAMLNIDVPALEEKNNLSALFRIGSDLGKKPEGTQAIVDLSAPLDSSTVINYYSIGENTAASDLIDKAATYRLLYENTDLAPAFVNVFKTMFELVEARKGQEQEKAPDDEGSQLPPDSPQQAFAQEPAEEPTEESAVAPDEVDKAKEAEERYNKAVAQFQEKLNQLPDSVGPKDAPLLVDYTLSILEQAEQLQNFSAIYPEAVISKIAEGYKIENVALAKDFPIVAFIHDFALSGQIPVPEILQKTIEADPLRNNYATLYSSANWLHSLFYLSHPEYHD